MYNFAKKNKDGWGMMWVENDQMKTKRTHTNDLNELYDTYLKLKDHEPVIHLRWRTAGQVIEGNSHPFDCGHGIYMMHNGSFHTTPDDKTHSDTYLFANMVLKPIFNRIKNPHAFIRTVEFYNLMICFMGWGNKVILMDRGGPILFPEDGWYTIKEEKTGCKGMVVSNEYAWNEKEFTPLPKVVSIGGQGTLSKKQLKKLKKQQERLALAGGTISGTNSNPGIVIKNVLGEVMTHLISNIYTTKEGKIWLHVNNHFERKWNLDTQPFFKDMVAKAFPKDTQPNTTPAIIVPPYDWEQSMDNKCALLVNPEKSTIILPQDKTPISDEVEDARDEAFQRSTQFTEEEYCQFLVKDWRSLPPSAIASMVYTDPDDAAKVINTLFRSVHSV